MLENNLEEARLRQAVAGVAVLGKEALSLGTGARAPTPPGCWSGIARSSRWGSGASSGAPSPPLGWPSAGSQLALPPPPPPKGSQVDESHMSATVRCGGQAAGGQGQEGGAAGKAEGGEEVGGW